MYIENIGIYECSDGQILAENITGSKGEVLMASYTTLNEYLIIKLHELGVRRVKIISTQNSKSRRLFIKKTEDKELLIKQILENLLCDFKPDGEILGFLWDSMNLSSHEERYIVQCLEEIKDYDEYTYLHSLNVSFYSALIGKWLRLSGEEIAKTIQAGILHDIGKTKISSKIINKKGALDEKEFEEVKRHAEHGYNIIADTSYIDEAVKKAVHMHHEREDGSGYPLGYTGSKVNIFAKIIAIADVFDAMTSNRVYRSKATPFDVFRMFEADGRYKFNKKIVSTFINNLANYYIGSGVKLNNNIDGKVVYVSPQSISCPIVKVGDSYIDLNKERELYIKAIFFENIVF